ncbi:MAG: alpha/beta hydrolase [Myxococcota bacterium]
MARGGASLLDIWRARGQWLDVLGLKIFVVEAGPDQGAAGGTGGGTGERRTTPLVVLHGFPTSSHDFEPALAVLAAERRVVLLDFPGFGLSAKPRDYSYSLLEQAEVAVAVWRRLGLTRAHVLAHDYGTSVATELLARRERDLLPFEIETLTLCNGSVHIELAQLALTQQVLRRPVVGPALARLFREQFFVGRMRRILGSPRAIDRARLAAMWQGVRESNGHERIPAISRYLDERTRFWSRWIGALRRFDRPTHVLWGRRDPIAVPAIAEALHDDVEGSALTWLDNLGHYPMLEDPRAWSEAVTGFLARYDVVR